MNTYKISINGLNESFIIDAETESDAVEQVKVLTQLEVLSGDIELVQN
jgi:hypothetical protein